MKLVRLSAYPYRLSFARPLNTGHGMLTERRGQLVILEDQDGTRGLGDVCPWPGFGTNDATRVYSELDRAVVECRGAIVPEGLDGLASFLSEQDWSAEVRAAFELALLDVMAKRAGRPLARLLDDAPLEAVPVQRLVNDASDTPLLAHAVKIKVGPDLDREVVRVGQVRERLGPETPIRLDANGTWSIECARAAIDRFAPFGIELIEQPVARAEELAAVREGSPIPIAADESVTDARTLQALLDANAVDVVILKPAFLGGLLATERLSRMAQQHGVRVVLTHAMGSAVERAGTLHAAASLRIRGACGLGHPFQDDVGRPYRIVSGLAHLGERPGHGVVIEGELEEVHAQCGSW